MDKADNERQLVKLLDEHTEWLQLDPLKIPKLYTEAKLQSLLQNDPSASVYIRGLVDGSTEFCQWLVNNGYKVVKDD